MLKSVGAGFSRPRRSGNSIPGRENPAPTVFLCFVFLLTLASPTEAKVLQTIDEFLEDYYEDAETILEERHSISSALQSRFIEETDIALNPEFDREFLFHIPQKGGEAFGYAAEHTVQGKWGGIHFVVALTPEGVVEQVRVLDYSEIRGKPVKKNRFLKQYKGKSIKSPLKLGKDVQGVSGATISSRGMTNGIKKILFFFEEFYR